MIEWLLKLEREIDPIAQLLRCQYNIDKYIIGWHMVKIVEFDIVRMRAAADEATLLLRALSNPDRLLLLCHLFQGERCVSDLEEELEIRQPTLSQQLTVLRTDGLVTARRDGRRIYYSVKDPKVLVVLETLYCLFCAPSRKRHAY